MRIARRIVAQPAAVNQQDLWDRWLAVAFLVSPDEFLPRFEERLADDPGIVWALRDLTGAEYGRSPSYPLTPLQAEVIVRSVGARFSQVPRPSGVMNGNTNAWDAANFVRSLISMLSASLTAAASAALERLEADPALSSYRDAIRHALAGQHTRRRDAKYHRPNWDEAVSSFDNRSPANAAEMADDGRCSGRRTGPSILYPPLACGSATRSNVRARPIALDFRQEPGAGKPHAGICAGGREQSLSLPRPRRRTVWPRKPRTPKMWGPGWAENLRPASSRRRKTPSRSRRPWAASRWRRKDLKRLNPRRKMMAPEGSNPQDAVTHRLDGAPRGASFVSTTAAKVGSAKPPNIRATLNGVAAF